MNSFEDTASFILPHCPVAKRKQVNKRGVTSISGATGNETNTSADVSAAGGIRNGIGKTGVEFRFYKKKEYDQLSQEQQDELREHRKRRREQGTDPNPSGKKQQKKQEKSQKKMIAAAVTKQITAMAKKEEDDFDLEAYVKALIATETKGATAASAEAQATPTAVKRVTLKSLLKRATQQE